MGETIRRRILCLERSLAWICAGWLLIAACEETSEELPIRRFRPTSPGAGQVQAKLGRTGGTLTLVGGASAAVPDDALASETWLAIKARDFDGLASLPEGLHAISRPYSFLPIGQRFAKPVALQLAYDESRKKSGLFLLRLDDARDLGWEKVPAATSVGVARTSTQRFGIYVVARKSDGPDAGEDE